MLERERAYYDQHLDEWLTRYRDRFVVVKDEQLIGTFDTADDALAAGARRFGLASFLVRRVVPVQSTALVRAPAVRVVQ